MEEETKTHKRTSFFYILNCKSFTLNCFLLEELEGLYSSPTVREQKTQIILSNAIPGHEEDKLFTVLKAKQHQVKEIATLHNEISQG